MATHRPRCQGSDRPLVKNGKTRQGKTRWRCLNCKTSSITSRQGTIHTKRFRLFIEWITNITPLTYYARHEGVSSRTLHRWFAPYWFIRVTPPPITRIYDEIMVDGTYFGKDCLLVAYGDGNVINWLWCHRENSANYTALFDPIPQPAIVVTDGGSGIFKAVTEHWPGTAIQRCLVHVQKNVRVATTRRPKMQVNKRLYRLSQALTRITTQQQATDWLLALNDIDKQFRSVIYARTYAKDVPLAQRPHRYRKNTTWWYTHGRTKRAYTALVTAVRRNQLFVYLDPPEAVLNPGKLHSTTNALEGGVNSHLKRLATNHRGRPKEHIRTAIDWWLLAHTELPPDPVNIAKAQNWGLDAAAWMKQQRTNVNSSSHDDGRPAIYDHGIATDFSDIGVFFRRT